MKRIVVLMVLAVLLLAHLQRTSLADGGLDVVFVSPEGELTSVEDGILVTFDRPVVPLGPASTRPDGPLRLDPSVPGAYRWLGTRTLAFFPERLPAATTITAVVPAGTKAVDGSTLAAEHRWTFHTRRPALVGSFPADDARWVKTGQPVLLRFNMPMDPARAAGHIALAGGPAVTVRALREGDVPEGARPAFRDDVAEGDTQDPPWPADRTLVVEPSAPLAPGREYSVEIEEGLLAREGDLGTAASAGVTFTTLAPLRVVKIQDADRQDPDGAVRFDLNNYVRPSDLAKHVRLDPPAPLLGAVYGDWDTDSPALSFALKPATRYRVTVDAGLEDNQGTRLGRDVALALRTTDRLPTLFAPLGARTLESYLAPEVPVGFVNVPDVRVRASRLSRESVVPALEAMQSSRWALRSPALDRVWSPSSKRNVLAYHPLGLGGLLDGASGLLALSLDPRVKDAEVRDSFTGTPRYEGGTFLQSTRMGLTAKFSRESALLWVTDLEDTRPVAGAEAELRSGANRVLWRGRTDAAGLVHASGLGLKSDTRLYWIVSRGKDLAVVGSTFGATVWPGLQGVDSEEDPPGKLEALMFTDRGLYRPGDEVRVKAVVRGRSQDAWTVPTGRALTLAVSDARGDDWTTKRVTVSPQGSFDLSLRLPAAAPTGTWRMTLRSGNLWHGTSEFRVEAYRPAQFQVDVRPERGDWLAGETLRARIQARYLFGAPMPAAPLKWSAFLAATGFSPPGWDGMSFGLDPWLDDRDREDTETLQYQAQSPLDAQGDLVVSLPLRATRLAGTLRLTVGATVSAPDRAELTGRGTALVHPAGIYVGLRPASTFLAQDAELRVGVVAVTPQGETRPGRPLELSLVRREYVSARRATGGGTEWVSTPKDTVVQTVQVTSGERETTTTVRAGGPGLYLLKATAKDDTGRAAVTTTGLYVYGGGSVGWERRGDDRLDLTPDRRGYKPGDVARVALASPFKTARALVTVERDGVLERFVTEVKGGAPVVSVPLRAAYAPNVYVSVALIQGRLGRNRFGPAGEDLARPAVRLGWVKIPVDPSGHRLQVSIRPDRTAYAPGDTVTVDLQAKDAAGRGRPAEITFIAADVGVLDLIDYHVPDPLARFYRERGLGVSTSETRHGVVGQRRYGEKGQPGGGGGPGAFVATGGSYRWNFEATPCWKPSLKTDAEGRVRVTFKLPDSVTAFRLTAVAHTADARFGEAEKEIRASRPLMLTPSWPRFCTVGDDATAGVLVHNQTGRGGDVRVTARLEGAALVGAGEQTVTVPAGESREVRFRFKAASAGKARFAFDATLGGHRDGLQASIPLQVPRLVEAAAVRESAEGALEVPLEVPADAVPGSARLDVTLAASALAGLRPAVEYLQAYPYECLEQKVSRVMPLVTSRDVVAAFGGDPTRGRALVEAVLDEMASCQAGGGGLSLWPGGTASPWVTAYALHLCARAKAGGWRVDERLCRGAVGYVKRALAAAEDSEEWRYPYSERERLATKAYMLDALRLWGEDDAATRSLLFERRDKMPVTGQAWLLRSLPAKEQATVARLLLDRLRVDPSTAHFEDAPEDAGWIYESPTRSTAVALEALLDAGRAFPQDALVVQWLIGQRRNGRWRTTQENAAVFAALSTWYRLRESAAPDFTASVRVAGRDLLREAFRGRDMRAVSRSTDLGTGLASLTMAKEGSGTAYLSALLRYAPGKAPEPVDAGLSVVKTVEVVEGKAESGDYAPGTLLRVRLIVSTSRLRRFVVLDDPLAGGMEVVQTTFETERADLKKADDQEGPWWGTFDHFEVYDDRVLLFADELTPGVHRYSYYARAAYPGRYAVPATRAEAMYEPEVYGGTASSEVIIK